VADEKGLEQSKVGGEAASRFEQTTGGFSSELKMEIDFAADRVVQAMQ
jgi:hypothetical protein